MANSTLPASLLLLADGRFPAGAHAHSYGLETAVARGLVDDLDSLADWITGCLHTTWTVDAAVAVQAARPRQPDQWARLDAEATARQISPQARRISRTLGRQLLRTGRAAWPEPALDLVAQAHVDGPLQPMALGAVAAAAGVAPHDVAIVSLHQAIQGAATAAVRLLGLDPYAVTALTAGLRDDLDATASRATDVGDDPAALPGAGAPMLDLLLAAHATAEIRFFAS